MRCGCCLLYRGISGGRRERQPCLLLVSPGYYKGQCSTCDHHGRDGQAPLQLPMAHCSTAQANQLQHDMPSFLEYLVLMSSDGLLHVIQGVHWLQSFMTCESEPKDDIIVTVQCQGSLSQG